SDMTFPDDLGEEMAQAFANIGRILEMAGATWDDVITVHSYHVDLPGNQDFVNATMGALFAQHMPHHRPTWTDVGVTALGHPRMRVEVQVVAHRSWPTRSERSPVVTSAVRTDHSARSHRAQPHLGAAHVPVFRRE